MSETVERAAKAAWAELERQHDGGEFWCSNGRVDGTQDMEGVAKAVIEAMREPTDWFIDTPRGKQIMADRNAAYRKACIQTNCGGKGVNESHCGVCAYCADIADDIIETHSNTIIDAALKD